jgi:hypothetical protein
MFFKNREQAFTGSRQATLYLALHLSKDARCKQVQRFDEIKNSLHAWSKHSLPLAGLISTKPAEIFLLHFCRYKLLPRAYIVQARSLCIALEGHDGTGVIMMTYHFPHGIPVSLVSDAIERCYFRLLGLKLCPQQCRKSTDNQI